MSVFETVLIFVAIPLAVYAVIAVGSMLGNPIAGSHPKHYDLGERWAHEPVLWSATDEVTTHEHGGHAAIESAAAESIGGSASGKW